MLLDSVWGFPAWLHFFFFFFYFFAWLLVPRVNNTVIAKLFLCVTCLCTGQGHFTAGGGESPAAVPVPFNEFLICLLSAGLINILIRNDKIYNSN